LESLTKAALSGAEPKGWGGWTAQFGIELDEVTSENVMAAKQSGQKENAEIGVDEEVCSTQGLG